MKNLNRWAVVVMGLATVLVLVGGAGAWGKSAAEKAFERFYKSFEAGVDGQPMDKEQPRPFKQRRIIVNDDGEVPGLSGDRTMADYLSERFADTVNTQVDSYFLCVGSTDRGPGHRPDPPRIQDSQNLWFPDKKLPRSVDRLTRAYLAATRRAGMEIFASFRMNDIHDAWADKLSYPLKVARPDLLIGTGQKYSTDQIMRAFWSGFDYAQPEVRMHFRDFILGYCRQYDYDGVELDYFRHPLFFKLGHEAENMDKMTDFVRQIRAGLDEIGKERGRPYLLTVRVPDNVQMCRMTGLDIERWLDEGLLDMLMVGGGYMPWSGRIKELIDLAHKHGIPAYPCINHFLDPAQMQAISSNFWALGADGIYIFNYYPLGDDIARKKCLNQLGDPDILLGLDKVYQPDNGCSIFYCGYTNPPPQFPVRLIDGTPIELVVGDDLAKAQKMGILKEVELSVTVANMDEAESINVQINGVQLLHSNVQRVDEQTFQVAVQPRLVRHGINYITVLPGLNSIARLSSEVTGMSLSVDYK